MSGDEIKWTARDVRRLLSNPVYAGLGPYPPIVTDELWAKAQYRVIAEQGARRTLRSIRLALRGSFDGAVASVEREEWIEESAATIKQVGAEAFFRRLLSELREELG